MNHFGIDTDTVVRVLAAIGFGAVVGFEREAADQAAGLRTHISVALGACIFGVISTLGFRDAASSDPTNVQIEVTRVASQVVVGIGFIGAGVIFRQGGTVRNLTTAASLWVTAAVGLAAGIGDVGLALVGTVGLVVSLALLRLPRRWIRGRFTKTTHEIEVRVRPGADIEAIGQALRSLSGVELKTIHTEKRNGLPMLRVALEAAPSADAEAQLATIAARDDVTDLHSVFSRQGAPD